MSAQSTLNKFTRINDLLGFLSDSHGSNLYIIYLKYRASKKTKTTSKIVFSIIKIAKINVIAKYNFGWLKDMDVEWVQLGPVLVDQTVILNTLQSNGYIKIEESPSGDDFIYHFKITEDGIRYIENTLRKIGLHPEDTNFSLPFEDEIIDLLKYENEELVNIATEHFGNTNSLDVYNIGEFKIIKIFDWEVFGDGTWKKCYDTLLWSLQSLDDSGRFRKIDAGLFGFDYYNVEKIFYYKPKNNETLRSVFQKSLPPTLSENKIEAKNYIINLWYILEAVNIFHAIIGLYPSVDDIARMCLLTYKLEFSKSERKRDIDKLRRLRESMLRKDIDKLEKAGLLKIAAKDGKKFLYRISALNFLCGSEKFELCSPDVIRNNYKLRKHKEALQVRSFKQSFANKADFKIRTIDSCFKA